MALPARSGATELVRWLLLKDLQILRRSPLLVALLVLYPIVIALLIGFALSRGPDKPHVAFLNGCRRRPARSSWAAAGRPRRRGPGELFKDVDVVPVDSARGGDRRRSSDGDVLGALIIPPDIAAEARSRARVRQARRSSTTARTRSSSASSRTRSSAQVQDANAALTKQHHEVALSYSNLIGEGGDVQLPRPATSTCSASQRRRRSSRERGRRCRRLAARAQLDAGRSTSRSSRVDNLVVLGRRAERRSASRSRSARRRQGRPHAARRLRGRARRERLADVRHAAAGRRHAGARARGERVLAAGARARVAHRAAGREGRARGRLLRRRVCAADAGRPGRCSSTWTGAASRCGWSRWPCGALASRRSAWRSAALDARGARGVAARVHAVAADRVPRARALGSGVRRRSTT